MTAPALDTAPVRRRLLSRPRLAIGLFVGLGLTGLALANAHLVYVAVTSQPACVTHEKERGDLNGKATFRAARPAC
jgi:hypothetical protein